MHPFAKIKRIPFSVPNIQDDYNDDAEGAFGEGTFAGGTSGGGDDEPVTQPTAQSVQSASTRKRKIALVRPKIPAKHVKPSIRATKPTRSFWNVPTRYKKPTPPVIKTLPPPALSALPTVDVYVEFSEYNGWEMETWRTYIPFAPNAKLLTVLHALITRLNRHHAMHEGHRQRHQRDRNEAQPCAMCTKYTLKLDQRYTRNEVTIRVDTFEDDVMYADHVVMPKSAQLDRRKLGQLCKWARVKQNVDQAMDKVHTTLYKNGIRKLFI